MKRAWIASLLFLGGCIGIPEGITPVDNFTLDRYLGKWYEIARLDHSFERGLSRVTAEYTLDEDGDVRVLNRGWSAEDSTWKDAEGTAKFVDREDAGHLKVSFFGPFYASYIVFGLDREAYSWSLVCSSNLSYLWILSRTPSMDPALRDSLVARARSLGFETDKLIFVDQQ